MPLLDDQAFKYMGLLGPFSFTPHSDKKMNQGNTLQSLSIEYFRIFPELISTKYAFTVTVIVISKTDGLKMTRISY